MLKDPGNTFSNYQHRRATLAESSECSSALLPRRILRKNVSMSDDQEHTRARSGSTGRVHFTESQMTPDHAGEIVVQLSPDRMHADAHLGFLQEGRRYDVQVLIPQYLGESVTVAKPNPHLQLKEIRHNREKNGHEVVLTIETYHDKLVNEEIIIKGDGLEESFVLSLSARVLGKGKGTPMLKRGIRCVGVEHLDSEMSDSSSTCHRPRTNSGCKAHPSADGRIHSGSGNLSK